MTAPLPYVPQPPTGTPLLMFPVRDEAEAGAIAAEWLTADACLYQSPIIDQLYLFVPVEPVVWRGVLASVPMLTMQQIATGPALWAGR
jgi:hypothetical protein